MSAGLAVAYLSTLGRGNDHVFFRDYRGGDVLMVATNCETSPDYYSQCMGRDIGLDVGDTNNGLLEFDSKLKDPFSHFLNINDMLIVQPERYIFHKLALRLCWLPSVRDL